VSGGNERDPVDGLRHGPEAHGRELEALSRELEVERRERRRLEGLLTTERQVLAGLGSLAPAEEILLALIRAMEDQIPGGQASILFLEEGRIQSGPAPSLNPDYMAALDGLPIGPMEGSCGTAAFRGETVLVSDVRTDELWKNYRTFGETYGFTACWSVPMKNSRGQVLGTLAVYRDRPGLPDPFTLELLERSAALAALALQRSRMLERLRETSDRLSLIHESSPVGIVLSEIATSRLLEVNEAWVKTVGWSRDEMLGRTSLELGIWADPNERESLARQLMETGSVTNQLVRIRRKDGTIRQLRVHVHRVEVDGVPCAVSLQRDVTEVVEQEERLRRAERLATVGTLVGGVAHELNNPLASIVGFCDLLLESDDRSEVPETLELIRREALRMTRIVDDVRVLARDAFGQASSPSQGVDAHEVLNHVLRLRGYTLRTSNITVEQDLASGSLPVALDRGGLEQILLNLLTNAQHALSHKKDGRRVLRLVTRSQAKMGVIRVVDTGVGIPKERMGRVFDPFYTTKEPGEGMGLGLSLVQKLVHDVGGELGLRSAEGEGTVVEVSLPLAATASPEPEPRSTSVEQAEFLRVLVVDDEEPIRRLLERALRRRGHEVETAVDGREALDRLDASRDRPFDRILSDLRMPGISGDELLSRLRARGRGEESCLVFMTGDHASPEAARVLEEAGVPWIVKPFTLMEVMEVLKGDGRPSSP